MTPTCQTSSATKRTASSPGPSRARANGEKHGLGVPEAVGAATREYRDDEDMLGEFVSEMCVTGGAFACAGGALFSAWSAWREGRGERPGSSIAFGKALEQAGYRAEKRSKGVRYRLGIDLNERVAGGAFDPDLEKPTTRAHARTGDFPETTLNAPPATNVPPGEDGPFQSMYGNGAPS